MQVCLEYDWGIMNSKLKLLILSVLIVLFPVSINAVSWEFYFKDAEGIKHFIEKDSIQKTPEGTILVWRQVIFPYAEFKLKYKTWDLTKSEYLWEIDCSRRMYKVLRGRRFGESGPIQYITKETDWVYFEPKDYDEAIYKKICEPACSLCGEGQ